MSNEIKWPERMVNMPCPDGSGDRILGFRVPEGDPIMGDYGLSEPLEWLRSVTTERAAPTPPAEAQVVASLREMLELREATQNGRVTDKPELDIVRDARAALSAQPRPDATFAEWLATEMPAGTIIVDPVWWANRIARQYAVRSSQPASAPVGVDVDAVLARHLPSKYWDRAKAAFSALAQQPAAVDEAMVARLADQLIARHWDIDPDCDGTGIVDLRDALSAALAQPQGEG